mmetsp:Transcript_12529/g.37617  ORF Transcript_12529/g.37617 Transcript_12529/m.37617 type:complete len:83 (+) Transcript_12529:1062-1310(+)
MDIGHALDALTDGLQAAQLPNTANSVMQALQIPATSVCQSSRRKYRHASRQSASRNKGVHVQSLQGLDVHAHDDTRQEVGKW